MGCEGSCGAAWADARAACMLTAHLTASTGLANSTRKPSPVVLTILPWCSWTLDSITSRQRPDPSEGPFFVLPHQLREPDHISGKDCCEAPLSSACCLHELGLGLLYQTTRCARAQSPSRWCGGRVEDHRETMWIALHPSTSKGGHPERQLRQVERLSVVAP